MAQSKGRQNSGPWIKKPRKFPSSIYVHKRGWAARIGGKLKVFAGMNIPQEEVLTRYYQMMAEGATQQNTPEMTQQTPVIEQKTAPLPVSVPSLLVEELKDKYIAHKEQCFLEGSFADRSLMSVREVVRKFAIAFPQRTTASLKVEDFYQYRSALAKKYSILALNRHVMNIRAMFQWGLDNYYVTELPKWGTAFKKPSVGEMDAYRRRTREKDGKKLFTPDQLSKLLKIATPQMKAMIYLGINCACGNTDIGKMPKAVVDFESKVMDYSRWKKGAERRMPLWPETIQAIQNWLKVRPIPADKADKNLLFLTPTGLPLLRVDPSKGENGKRIDYVTLWFANLLDTAKIARRGLGFYALRHTFHTTAIRTKDIYAVLRIMGHRLPGMGGAYTEQINDDQLRGVSDYVRYQMLGISDEDVIHVSSL